MNNVLRQQHSHCGAWARSQATHSAAPPDEHVAIVEMKFPEQGIIETELDCTATHLGALMGNPASGTAVRFTVYTRNRFEGDRMAECWDRVDVAGLLAQLKT